MTRRKQAPAPLPGAGPRQPRGCFVAGTDTGVGKTLVASLLAFCLQRDGIAVGVMKPVETGTDSPARSDAARLKTSIGCADPLDLISPYRLPAPLAPLAAAREAGVTIDLARIMAAFKELTARHEFLVVEGVGGVMVPLAEQLDVLNLIERLGLPVLVVGRATLGGVNHALLTIEALRRRRIAIAGMILNRPTARPASVQERQQQATTVSLLKELSGVRVVGPLPHHAGVEEDWGKGMAGLAVDPATRELVDLVRPGAS